MTIIQKLVLVLMVLGAIGFYGGLVVLAVGSFLGRKYVHGLDKKCDEP